MVVMSTHYLQRESALCAVKEMDRVCNGFVLFLPKLIVEAFLLFLCKSSSFSKKQNKTKQCICTLRNQYKI